MYVCDVNTCVTVFRARTLYTRFTGDSGDFWYTLGMPQCDAMRSRRAVKKRARATRIGVVGQTKRVLYVYLAGIWVLCWPRRGSAFVRGVLHSFATPKTESKRRKRRGA